MVRSEKQINLVGTKLVLAGRDNWPRSLVIASLIMFLLGGLAAVAGEATARWMHAYLVSLCFVLSISLGALFFVLLHHLTGARWSVVTRRIAELLTAPIPWLSLLFLPIAALLLLGDSQLFPWNDARLRQSDDLIASKSAYLNAPFFAFRAAVYFACWTGLAQFYRKYSLAQDHDSVASTQRMRRYSGPAMLVFAVTVNFAAFDWLMSLDPHWFSTIFGIYFFAGCAVAFFATLPLLSMLLQRLGLLRQIITVEHYHDMGKLLFGFTMFWAYIAFSQFLLIWYANIPEETVWFGVRQENGWQYVGLTLIVGHFILPLFGLMSRSTRRRPASLLGWSCFLLLMHWLDLYWLVAPSLKGNSPGVGLFEVLCGLGAILAWLAALLRGSRGVSLVPQADPYFAESVAFHNA